MNWVVGVIGLILIVAPFVLKFTGLGLWISIIVGLVLVIMAGSKLLGKQKA